MEALEESELRAEVDAMPKVPQASLVQSREKPVAAAKASQRVEDVDERDSRLEPMLAM